MSTTSTPKYTERPCEHNELTYHATWDLRDYPPHCRPEGLEELILTNCDNCHTTLTLTYEYLIQPNTIPARYIKKPNNHKKKV